MKPRPTILLDRDGTINLDTGHVYTLGDWRYLDGVHDALRSLQAEGFALAVVTNQSAVSDGRTSREQVERLHRHMTETLAAAGIHIAAVAYCPHARDAGCDCRKPRTGLFSEIERRIGPIDRAASWMVGDKPSDIGFGQALGLRTALIRSRYWDEATLEARPDLIIDSLLEFAHRHRECDLSA